ncbi:FAD:protein FMN transferase [Sphingomonas sp.]|uniref:FAD:protein FMN transferase n=1 Tax=Sphingomonas sp. TaxID=28214 RepID=UPI002C571E34|nr:FAD:protein FMN transferase [Sphingomonas sp.]HWK34983.1 FAD:protein FMN transferase [Sphingomonas sp.]
MGTRWSAQIVAAPGGAEEALRAVLDGVIASMSQWAPDSALSRFNRAPPGEWRTLPDDLARVLDTALAIGRASAGAFDPAAGALADLWGFGPPGPRADVPAADAVAQALARSGAAAIERSDTRARRTADVALDLSGIGKGYAVDALAARLRALGCEDFLVEIGGEFVGAGVRPDAQPWWVELENPPGVALPPIRIALHGIAVATSGDYRRFIADGARRLGHTIDPRTGRPITNGVVSASVIASDCMTADGWATALTVLGPGEGVTVAAREGLAARIVTGDGAEHLSPALEAMLG